MVEFMNRLLAGCGRNMGEFEDHRVGMASGICWLLKIFVPDYDLREKLEQCANSINRSKTFPDFYEAVDKLYNYSGSIDTDDLMVRVILGKTELTKENYINVCCYAFNRMFDEPCTRIWGGIMYMAYLVGRVLVQNSMRDVKGYQDFEFLVNDVDQMCMSGSLEDSFGMISGGFFPSYTGPNLIMDGMYFYRSLFAEDISFDKHLRDYKCLIVVDDMIGYDTYFIDKLCKKYDLAFLSLSGVCKNMYTKYGFNTISEKELLRGIAFGLVKQTAIEHARSGRSMIVSGAVDFCSVNGEELLKVVIPYGYRTLSIWIDKEDRSYIYDNYKKKSAKDDKILFAQKYDCSTGKMIEGSMADERKPAHCYVETTASYGLQEVLKCI